MTITYMVGDTRDRCADIKPGSVALIATSPPFIALRSYLPDGHPAKHLEIGSEIDPPAFIDVLLACVAQWGELLAPWGSIAVELGDTYAGSGGAGGDYLPGGLRNGQSAFAGSAKFDRSSGRRAPGGQPYTDMFKGGGPGGSGWPRPKSLALIPQAFALSLAYGINVLTGERSPAGCWLVRNVIVWHRPNPAVGALGDKVRPSTSYITVATRASDRWFDLTAVRNREPGANTHARTAQGVDVRPRTGKSADRDGNFNTMPELAVTGGAPPLDCWFDEWDPEHDTWTMSSQPSKLAHYAMWPPKLAERLILMMCPAEVCRHCNEPRRRIEHRTRTRISDGLVDPPRVPPTRNDSADGTTGIGIRHATQTTVDTLGWSHCGCAGGRRSIWHRERTQDVDDNGEPIFKDDGAPKMTSITVYDDMGASVDPDQYRPGVVLDPFGGTGTTVAVADLHGRDGIAIDIDERNEHLVVARRAECRRALFGDAAYRKVKKIRKSGEQIDLFGGAA